MGKIMEAIFCICYLVSVSAMGVMILRSSRTMEHRLFAWMTLILVCGDAFHLVPRILAALRPAGEYTVALGVGKQVTSITMTVFYAIMYFVYCLRYGDKNRCVGCAMMLLAAIRIALCLMPQNDWTGAAPVIWGVYRNIPFALMGIVMIVLYARKRADRAYRWMGLAIALSFAFYIPVVLWADVSPMIGMLMMPKTCMYVWIVVMGLRDVKRAG